MHEASLAGGVLKVVEDAARREGFRRVLSLRLEVGQLAGVEVRALRFALEAIAPGSCLQDAVFEIDEAWCLPCGETITLAQRGQACPRCGGHQMQPTGGTELRVVEMRVSDSEGEPACV